MEWNWLKNKLIENNFEIDNNKILNAKETIKKQEDAIKNEEIKNFFELIKKINKRSKDLNLENFINQNKEYLNEFFIKYVEIIKNRKLLSLLKEYLYNFYIEINDLVVLHILFENLIENKILKINSFQFLELNSDYKESFLMEIAFKKVLEYIEISKYKYQNLCKSFYLFKDDKNLDFDINNDDFFKYLINKNEKSYFKKLNDDIKEFELEVSFPKLKEKIYWKKWKNDWFFEHYNLYRGIKDLKTKYETKFNQYDLMEKLNSKRFNFESMGDNEFLIYLYKTSLFLLFSFLSYLNKNIKENNYINEKTFSQKIEKIDDLKNIFDFFIKNNIHDSLIINEILLLNKK